MEKSIAAVSSSIENQDTLFVALELSRATWLAATFCPRLGDQISIHSIPGGDAPRLIELIGRLRAKIQQKGGPSVRVISCYEAGYDGFWLHRALLADGVDNQILDAASLPIDRRAKHIKTDNIDAKRLLRAIVGHTLGDRPHHPLDHAQGSQGRTHRAGRVLRGAGASPSGAARRLCLYPGALDHDLRRHGLHAAAHGGTRRSRADSSFDVHGGHGDQFGRHRAHISVAQGARVVSLLRFSMLAMGLAFLILGAATRPILLAPAMIFLGCGIAVVFSALSIVISELVPGSVLGRATAISSSVTFLGQFFSPLLLGPLMAATSITLGYLVLSGTAALIFLILVIAGWQTRPALAPGE